MLTMPAPLAEALRGGGAHLARRPLVLLAVACVLGIIWADWAVPPLLPLYALCLLTVALGAYSLRRNLPATNAFMLLAIFLLGAALHTRLLTPSPRDRATAAGVRLDRAEGTVAEVVRADRRQQQVTVSGLRAGDRALPVRVRMNLPASPKVGLADRLLLEQVRLGPPPRSAAGAGPDYVRTLAREGIHTCGFATSISSVDRSRSVRRTVDDWLTQQRAGMLRILREAMPGPGAELYADLLAGMVYGVKAVPVAPEIKERFRRTGTIHLLIASGTQVSVICLSLIFLVRGTRRVLPLWGIVAVGCGLFALALIAGLGVSIVRAVAMALLLLGSFASGRRYEVPTALALSALMLCLIWPGYVFDLAAQLTYACCVGVYLAMPLPGSPSVRGWRGYLGVVARGTLGAWAGAAPLIAANFHNVVLTAGIANLAAVPLAIGVLYVGLFAIVLGSLWMPLAIVPCACGRLLLEALLWVIGVCLGLPLAGLDPVYPSRPELLLWYAAVAAAFWVWRSHSLRALARTVDWRLPAVAAVVLVAVPVVGVTLGQLRAGELQVDVLNVGAAQCLLVRPPRGDAVLIDAGAQVSETADEDPAQQTILPFLGSRGVRRLGAVVLSHAHEDHCNLAARVIAQYPPRQLVLGPADTPEQSWPTLLEAARARGIPTVQAAAGATIPLGDDTSLQVLEPYSLLHGTADDSNNNSLVLRLVYRGVRIMLPADLQAEGEQRLLADYAGRPDDLRADVLIAAHHASVHSNTERFVRAVAPRVVAISCGRGSRRPRAEALEVFARRGLDIWRTDVCGTIHLTCSGGTIRLRGARPR